jgi:predicted O-methyltransferase YrrM
MLGPDEQRLLYSLARDTLTGAGAVIDGGAFLGGSTIALACGLEASDRDSAQWPLDVKW